MKHVTILQTAELHGVHPRSAFVNLCSYKNKTGFKDKSTLPTEHLSGPVLQLLALGNVFYYKFSKDDRQATLTGG